MTITTMPRTPSAGDALRHRCEDLVAIEMDRLTRRVPALRPEHLGHVRAALGRVVDRLVLSRAGSLDGDQLVVLFDLTDTP